MNRRNYKVDMTILKRLLMLLLTIFMFMGCSEENSNDAHQTYKYWAGIKPPDDLELMEGKYWQSAHWTKEYIMYLKFKPTKIWWEEFLKQNNFSENTDQWIEPSDAPSWFKPSVSSIIYGTKDSFDQGSRYFRDKVTGVCYIYEIQL